MFIRVAEPGDAPGILSIYSPYILNSGITQETELPTTEGMRQRVIQNLEERPWIVCESGGEIAGYAYAGKHRERKGYQWCIEPSVYIGEKFHRSGIATALYTALFDILKLQGFVNAYAVITLPNDKSVAFHERFGFHYLTTYKKIGYKLGRWHDVGWWEKQVNEYPTNPTDPTPFRSLDKNKVMDILNGTIKK